MARPVCGRSFLPRADKRVSSPKHFRWAPICTTIWYWSSYRRGKLSCRGKLPTQIFVLLQPFPCREIMIIDLFLVALLSLVCLVLTDSSSLVTRLTEECHRSDGERSLEWQTPAVAYPFGSLHDLCVAVVVVLLDEVVRHFRQDLSVLLIICHTPFNRIPVFKMHHRPFRIPNVHSTSSRIDSNQEENRISARLVDLLNGGTVIGQFKYPLSTKSQTLSYFWWMTLPASS